MKQSPKGEMRDSIQAQVEGVIHLEPLPLRWRKTGATEGAEEGRLFLLLLL